LAFEASKQRCLAIGIQVLFVKPLTLKKLTQAFDIGAENWTKKKNFLKLIS
tara:strand:- start:1205 stop:1357 length:153 start_codon:yes stop_codon:yes gene_type:complete